MFLKALVIDPMFPRQLFLGFLGICAGSIIAAGVFASGEKLPTEEHLARQPHTGTGQNL